MKYLLLAGVCWGLGCNHCGDGILDSSEACDDGNNIGGDVCGAQCSFEAPTTSYRLSALILTDEQNPARFGLFNAYLSSSINHAVIEDGLHFLFQFDSTQEGATALSFGPGVFVSEVGGVATFGFAESLDGIEAAPTEIETRIDDGAITAAETSLFLPLDIVFGEGVYRPLLLEDVSFSTRFGHEQSFSDLSFVDVLEEDSTFRASVSALELCAIDISAFGVRNNLLDVFDDGVSPVGDAAVLPSSIVPSPGEAPDPANCQPCRGPGVDPATCVFPDIDPNGSPSDPLDDDGDERYTLQGTFEARGIVIRDNLP